MKVRAAVMRTGSGPFTIEDLELEAPRGDEVLVRMVAAGMCHTDLLMRELPPEFFPGPQVYGHEGSGIVEAIVDGESTAPGDFSLEPSPGSKKRAPTRAIQSSLARMPASSGGS